MPNATSPTAPQPAMGQTFMAQPTTMAAPDKVNRIPRIATFMTFSFLSPKRELCEQPVNDKPEENEPDENWNFHVTAPFSSASVCQALG